MKQITLQRQGISNSIRTNHSKLLTPGVGNDATPFFVEIQEHLGYKPSAWIGCVTLNDKRHSTKPLPTIEACREAVAALLTTLTGEPITIDSHVELYCPGCRVNGDVEFARARYEEATDTIRSVPENYCLVAWTDGKPVFDVDGATADEFEESREVSLLCRWRTICRKAHDAYNQPVNKPGTTEGKQWLAWLISEYRKYGYNT